jgi:DNA-binding protein HU-beta
VFCEILVIWRLKACEGLRISPDPLQGVATAWSVVFPFYRSARSVNKSELIAKVAQDTKLTRGEAEEVVESTIENIIEALKGGDDVRLMGFGVFTVTRRKSGEARNPKTGKIIKMPASKRARFKPGKLLKEAVNS